MKIVGASFNSPESNGRWVAEQKYRYEVWSDSSKTLALHYGSVSSDLLPTPGRITLLLDAEGKLLREYRKGTSSPSHPQQVLEDCARLFGD